jgi:hypothetical protein
MTGAGFPHSEILGSRFVCQLPEAYRRLPRPSSAPGAKASTLCPYKLQPQKTKMLASTVQFSNNDQDHHRTRPPPPATASWSAPERRPRPPHTHPPPTGSRQLPRRSERTPTHGGCSLRTQQCVLTPPASRTPHPFHPPANQWRTRTGDPAA